MACFGPDEAGEERGRNIAAFSLPALIAFSFCSPRVGNNGKVKPRVNSCELPLNLDYRRVLSGPCGQQKSFCTPSRSETREIVPFICLFSVAILTIGPDFASGSSLPAACLFHFFSILSFSFSCHCFQSQSRHFARWGCSLLVS